MIYITAVLVALVAYLVGSVSGAILISKAMGAGDIRNEGSKNAGTTNMLRIHGKKAAVLTLIIDILKGVFAVLIGIVIDYFVIKSGEYQNSTNVLVDSMKYVASVFVVLGHDFPIYFGFRGGKGVATAIGAILMLDWKIGLILIVASIIIMAVSRYVSLGSVIGAFVYPFIVLAFMLGKNSFSISYFVSSIVLALLVILKHHTNIKRLVNGNENKLFSK